jgi:hypothetical protein
MGVCNGYQMPVLVRNQRDSIYQPRIPKPAGDRIPFDMRADLDEAKRCHRVSASRAIVPGARPEIARRDPERKSRHGPPSMDVSRRIGKPVARHGRADGPERQRGRRNRRADSARSCILCTSSTTTRQRLTQMRLICRDLSCPRRRCSGVWSVAPAAETLVFTQLARLQRGSAADSGSCGARWTHLHLEVSTHSGVLVSGSAVRAARRRAGPSAGAQRQPSVAPPPNPSGSVSRRGDMPLASGSLARAHPPAQTATVSG